MYPERLTNQITWAKPDPPPNALHTTFTHLKAVEATAASPDWDVREDSLSTALRNA